MRFEALVTVLVAPALGLRETSLPNKGNRAREVYRWDPRRRRATLASCVPPRDSDCLDGPCALNGPVVALKRRLYGQGGDLDALGLEDSLGSLTETSDDQYDDAYIVKAAAVDI